MFQSLQQFDTRLFFMINDFHHPVADVFFLVITQLGNGWFLAPLLTFMVWRKTTRKRFMQLFVLSVIGMALCGIFNSQLKRRIKRPRPPRYFALRQKVPADSAQVKKSGGDPVQKVHVVGPVYHSKSFPSGHTNTAFSAATLLVILFGRSLLWAYIPALFVGYSRVYLGVHFPLDVVGGAFLGSLMMWAYMLLVSCFRKIRFLWENSER